MPNIVDYLAALKADYEHAILTGGKPAVNSLITSKLLINHIHEYIKDELVANNINPEKIYPSQGTTKPELKMQGFLKPKSQDISVLPSLQGTIINAPITDEYLDTNKTEKVAKDIMEKSISINIRSQLSSGGKNFDTLYERTFAEALNLHLRIPKLVMGEVYLIPLVLYNSTAIKNRRIQFTEKLPSKYIPAFQAINNRIAISGNEYKYERVCLLIVDFRTSPPTLINNANQLVANGIITQAQSTKYSLTGLTINDFVKNILQVYVNRHGNLNSLV